MLAGEAGVEAADEDGADEAVGALTPAGELGVGHTKHRVGLTFVPQVRVKNQAEIEPFRR